MCRFLLQAIAIVCLLGSVHSRPLRRLYYLPWTNFWRRLPLSTATYKGAIFIRAGSVSDCEGEARSSMSSPSSISESLSLSLIGDRTRRRCSDLVLDLRPRASSNGVQDESLELRKLIVSRSLSYLCEIQEAATSLDNDTGDRRQKIPHPKKLLHFLASKVPAIRQSPDVNLRIHSARSDMDSGLAASIISTVAHVCEMYDHENAKRARHDNEKQPTSAALSLMEDRRFEQLVECVLSGVNMKKRNREAMQRGQTSVEGEDIEELLDDEELTESDGLSTRDACRAVWGLALLGAHHLDTLGGENVLDLLRALSLRTRELLLARLKLLTKDDLLSDPALAHLSTEERLNELSEELAEDAASAMWTFACVRACTGLRSVPLFETCCSILCQDPVDLRRRSQEIDGDNASASVGNNDIVDRLARADASEHDEDSQMSNMTKMEKSDCTFKDSLLDWLSKTQINDVMWALALHGKENRTVSADDVTLSETAATLGEIAFDRLIEALEEDLKIAETRNFEAETIVEDVLEQEEGMMVEVVDAAALLESEASESTQVPANSVSKLPVESMTLKANDASNEKVEHVQVVDAAALLARVAGNASAEIHTEIMVTSVSGEPDDSFEDVVMGNDTDDTAIRDAIEVAPPESRKEKTFSPHDLAGIAWSATELCDPLRMRILPMVVKLIAMLGESGTEMLSGSDLANLAWAISKYESDVSVNVAHRPSSTSLSVISWMSHTALTRIVQQEQSSEKLETAILGIFQPPELGRFTWAVACVMSTYAQVPDSARMDENIQKLATAALKSAAANLSLFATEDLLRICWSFLELRGGDGTAFDASVSIALGKILSTVEQSLYRWERGDCRDPSTSETTPSGTHQEGSIFSSFFGNSRHNQPLLEQLVGDHEDDDDNELAPILKKSRRPLLRDLSVDPSTLCKAACAFQRLLVKHPKIKGGWKLTNVAIRLLTSRNARLMKECSIHDIVRLCEAAIRSDTEGQGRELIMGLFAHKVVQVLNEVLYLSDSEERTSSIKISAASPSEIATLIWALGDLGVKHALPDDSRRTAYKRLRLMTTRPLMSLEQVKSLDILSATRLLRGVVLMKIFQSDSRFLLSVVEQVQANASRLESVEDLVTLAETLALLKEALKSGEAVSDEIHLSMKGHQVQEPDETPGSLAEAADASDSGSSNHMDSESTEKRIVDICDSILSLIASEVTPRVGNATAQEIRRLLSVYSLLPFHADELVDSIDREVKGRLQVGTQSPHLIQVEDMLQEAKAKSESVQQELFQENHSSSLQTLKNGIMGLFRSPEEDESPNEANLSQQVATMIQDSINSTVEVSIALQELQHTLHISIDSIGQQISEGTYFELGRCQELIANYRLVEFSTGIRRSRYDLERRIEISKRVLSRLLP